MGTVRVSDPGRCSLRSGLLRKRNRCGWRQDLGHFDTNANVHTHLHVPMQLGGSSLKESTSYTKPLTVKSPAESCN